MPSKGKRTLEVERGFSNVKYVSNYIGYPPQKLIGFARIPWPNLGRVGGAAAPLATPWRR